MANITALKRKLKLEEHTTKNVVFYLKDKHGNPIDLTGWTAKSQIKSELDGDTILTITTESAANPANIVIDPELGKVTLHIDHVYQEYEGVYDLFLFDADGEKYKLVRESTITVIPSVTDVADINGEGPDD